MASSHEVLTTHSTNMESKDIHENPNSLNSSNSSTQNRSWQEIKQAVRASRKLHAQFANKIPHDFIFVSNTKSEDGNLSGFSGFNKEKSNGNRLFFLGVLPEHRENTLLYIDIPVEPSAQMIDSPVEWSPVLGVFQPSSQMDKYSKEEQLLRERKRLGVHGITSYEISHDNKRLLFPAAGSLFTMELSKVGRTPASAPKEIVFQQKGTKLDTKMCPENPDIVSYIFENDLWVINIQTGVEKRLTYSHKGCENTIVDSISSGVASYIIQEEFDRYTGYWWQPRNTSGVYRILYEEVDESNVEILHISNLLGKPDIDSYRYPRSGTANAKVTLKMVEFTVQDGRISDPSIKVLSQQLDQSFPWYEYIVRINWVPDGSGIWAQLLDRSQQQTAIVYIPFDLFTVTGTLSSTDIEMDDESTSLNADSAETDEPCFKILYEEKSNVWINVHDTYHFFKATVEDTIDFIWASEKTSRRHLYHVHCNLRKQNGSKRQRNDDGFSVTSEPQNCCVVATTLTTGDWEVMEHNDSLWVDEAKKLVYFIALKDTPLESHLYVTSYETLCPPVRLTKLGMSHSVSLSQDCQYFVTVSSNVKELYSASVYALNDSSPLPRPSVTINLLEPLGLSSDYSPPELFSFSNSVGITLHGMFHKPHNLQPGKKYPTLLYVYGGPHVQLVTNSFKGLRYQRLYTLASLGYVVVAIDGRGSAHRGLEFESILKNKMGQVEIQDQVEGLRYLSDKLGYIDMSRVAIHGWSYGGYLTLMGLIQRQDIFKVAIAGAPVTCWKLYDTGYTERYMNTPEVNQSGYHYGSILKSASKFPDEPNRLFIVHGLIDENVHFVHTAQLIASLVKRCKPYQLQIYPNERHGIRSAECNEHYEVIVISYLQQYL